MADDLVKRLRRDLASGLSASIGDTKDAADEIKRLRKALAVIYRAHEKAMDEGETWFVTDDTTVGGYICSVLGAPPEEVE